MAAGGDARRSNSVRFERRGGIDHEELGRLGLCECGCGQPTRLAPQTDTKKGWIKGKPLRFRRGHALRIYQRGPISDADYAVMECGHATPCWIWQGHLGRYGTITRAGVTRYAHRASYEQFVGPIPPGLDIDHLCSVTACINPAHLEPVPPAVNSRRQHRAKLTAADVAKIRRDTRTHVAVAADFGVSATHILRVRRGEKWAPARKRSSTAR